MKMKSYDHLKIAKETAISLLYEYYSGDFPINVVSLVKQLPMINIKIKKLSVFAKEQGISTTELQEYIHFKDGCSCKFGNDYLILYNDTITTKQRIRFTIAHEIGHIILGHLDSKDSNIIVIDKIFEEQANAFASQLLSPDAIGCKLHKNGNLTKNYLIKLFDISNKSSDYVYDRIINNRNCTHLENEICEKFDY